MDIPTKAIKSIAEFSECMQYRYSLIRDFASGKGSINFIMLNPSTANETFNDPTVARCENRAIDGGFAQMVVTNIMAYRATDPNDMRSSNDPVGSENDKAILAFAEKADEVICAWGEHGKFLDRGNHVKALLKSHNISTKALKINKSGHPAHPLYLPKKLEPFVWQ